MTGVYRTGFAALILAPFFFVRLWKHRSSLQLPLRGWLFLFGAGFWFGIDLHTWHKSIVYIGAGLSTILANTQVLYSAVFGLLVLGERPAARFWLSIPAAFLGIAMLVRFHGGVADPAQYRLGVILGLSAGACYAAYILFLRQAEQAVGGMNTLQKITLICAISCAVMFCLAAFEGNLALPSPRDAALLSLLAFVSQVGGWMLIARNLPQVPIATAGLILLSQPVLATLLGSVIFNERMQPLQILGAAVTLGALYWGSTTRARPQK